MKSTTLMLVSLVALALAACSEAAPTAVPTEAPTPLPTAVQPQSTTGGSWAVTFAHEFASDTWEGGEHRYGFHVSCQTLEYNFASPWQTFTATQNEPVQPFPIFLRLNGLSVQPFVVQPLPENRINLEQQTVAMLHLVGLTEEQVAMVDEDCDVLFTFDREVPIELTPLEPFQP